MACAIDILAPVVEVIRLDRDGEQIERVRRLCADLPQTSEKLSHGAPTFFAGKVFATFADNVHGDGHIGVWLPVPEGDQEVLIQMQPKVFFRPPYVGTKGWVGIELKEIGDEELASYLLQAWKLVSKKNGSHNRLRISY